MQRCTLAVNLTSTEQCKQLDTIGHCRKFEAQPQMLPIAHRFHMVLHNIMSDRNTSIHRLGETQIENGIQQTPAKERRDPRC